MLKNKIKDIQVRKSFQKQENKTTTLKFIYTNFLNKNKNVLRFEPLFKIKQRNFSKTKIVRRCILSDRSRGSIRPFNVSRIKLRDLFQFGVIPGYKKAAW